MGTTYKDADLAIFTRLANNWTATPIHAPGQPFEPQTQNYIQPRILWTQGYQGGYGKTGVNHIRGVLHVNIFIYVPGATPSNQATIWADTIRGIFAEGTLLGSAPHKAVFSVPRIVPAIEDETWYQLPVECPFQLFEDSAA